MQNVAELEQTNQREIVSFRVSGKDFSIDIGYVREIRGWSPTTILPHTPDYVKGVMNLRGNVIPVMDLSHRLGLGPTEPTERHVIVITVLGDKTVGLLVEAVSDIMSVPADELKPTPDLASTSSRDFVEGVYMIEDSLIRVMDIHQVFARETGGF
ncbi:MAG: chemotaxis protein CheW [Rhodobacteraceae bacterium]|nr:chemotaxis protein CheW [Paracoccaceae bacterium]